MRKSKPLSRAISNADAEVGFEANGRLAGLRPEVAERLARELDAGNVRVLLWLADRMRLGVGLHGVELRPEPAKPVEVAAPGQTFARHEDFVLWSEMQDAKRGR